MTRQLAGAILRLIAILVFLVGAILTTGAAVGLYGMDASRTEGFGLFVEGSAMVSNMGIYLLLAHAQIAAWGVILYLLSPLLAWFICGTDEPRRAASGA